MKKIVLAAVAALSVSGAFAQAYVGAGLSINQLNVNCAGTQTCSTQDAGGKAYGGYVWPSGVGVEVAYHLLGAATSSAMVSSTLVRTEYEASGFGGAVVFRGAVSRNFWVHAKLGMLHVTTTAISRSGVVAPVEVSESTTKPYLGLGMEYGFVESVKLLAYMDMTKGKIGGSTASIRGSGLGVEFIF
jgi:OOP family OmpA-OmpF porin